MASPSQASQCEICVVGSSQRAVTRTTASIQQAFTALQARTNSSPTSSSHTVNVSARVIPANAHLSSDPQSVSSLLSNCNAYIICGDADQSRLLVCNSTRDTSVMHEAVQYIFSQRSEGVLNGSGAVLAVVGGLQRGYLPPGDGQMWSHTVEELLRKTGQVW
jgi:hypothetical protein